MKTQLDAIITRFRDEVELKIAELKGNVQYDNTHIDPQPDYMWIRTTLLIGESLQIELGPTGSDRTVGLLIAQIFAPRKEGLGRALRIADTVRDAFNPKTETDGVTYLTPSIVNAGRSGEFHQMNVRCPFQFDEVT